MLLRHVAVEPLTIVHVLTSYQIGGGEQVALNLAGAQVELGHEVHVVALDGPADGPHAASFSRASVTAHRVARLGPTADPSLPARLAWLFRRIGARIVHTHNPLPLMYGGLGAKLAQLPVVHTKHGLNHALRRRVWLRRAAGRFADAMVAVSKKTAEDARRDNDCAPERLLVVENGIRLDGYHPDPEARAQIRRELGIPPTAWVVGTVGRLSPVKNQPLLVSALAPLLSDTLRLVIVGDGSERSRLEAQRSALPHPEYLHLLGQRLDVARLLASFDVFALTSDSEGLPMVLPEAMATGLPVVATRVGGVPEVVEEAVTGHLVGAGDADGLRRQISALAEDPARALALGATGREQALARFGADRMVQEYMALYERLLHGRSARYGGGRP